MKHSRGTWFVDDDNCNLKQVVNDKWSVAKLVMENDAERIVACVNACEGITTEALDAGILKLAIESWQKEWMKEMKGYVSGGEEPKLATLNGIKIWEEL